ncbi:GDP-mannose-dependent alpha-(1-6)-phosphatidylinositol dimannoside mannosyltransferase [Nocardia wallacei]|uniref:GDP-mannose-dependent alpha-(1-6)-phosphatidylinositol dimannoside mannosyltransferase n=2 Tax=Nocardia wallacei TaxID=480035 RepID=A0A7G1KPJ9_9NOCA|nr:GDP-mannose-dependent alpha-(1-6)-phosphatidylinositol dimannoside mannosyltransferase [Nocardia wallacei]
MRASPVCLQWDTIGFGVRGPLMRIVQLANFYTPASGGLRTCVDEIGRGYVAAGHERVLVVPGLVDADEHTAAGRRITVRGPRFGSAGYHVLTARRTRPLLRHLRPDVLECSDKLSMRWLAPWARRTGVPLVLFSHERIDAILRTRVPPGFPLVTAADLANRRLAARVERIVVTSEFARAEFTRIGARNVHRIPLGVDLDTFRPAATSTAERGRPTTESGKPQLILVSRLSREKHPERAIEALQLLRHKGIDADLTVVGDGPLRADLEHLAAGLPVRFQGHVPGRKAVADMIAAADIALCPSPAETFGLAVLEALACGTPVVVPHAGAARELLGSPGSGLACDGTPAGLATATRDLLSLPLAQRRRAARHSAERFPWSRTVTGMLDLYENFEPALRSA